MRFDFLLPAAALGYDQGEVRTLNPYQLCDDVRGLSGTEITALGLAWALMRLGHQVRLRSHWTALRSLREGAGGVDFLDLEACLDPPDVALAFHDGAVLTHWEAPLTVVWHQTLTPPHVEDMGTEEVDLYLSSTRVNAQHLRQYTGDKPWRVVPNGWDFGTYPLATPVPGRVFYHTSPERGLHILLRAWPQIVARVPEAHLVVWSRLDQLGCRPTLEREIQGALAAHVGTIALHGEGGSRHEVLASLATASVLAYPSEPPVPCEVMPVSVMEACALGVPVVTAPSDNFHRAFGWALDVCPWPPSEHLNVFVEHVVQMLTQPRLRHGQARNGRRWAARHTFAHTAARFLEVMAEAQQAKETICSLGA